MKPQRLSENRRKNAAKRRETTVLKFAVDGLRAISAVIIPATGGRSVYFPPKERGAAQPVRLSGYVGAADLADLVHYLADMLED